MPPRSFNRGMRLLVAAAAVLALLLALGSSPAAARNSHTEATALKEGGGCVLPSGFVHLRDVAPTVIQEIRYATHHNFLGRPAAMYTAGECILSVPAAQSLAKVQEFLSSGAVDPVSGRRYSLKVYDCYRPAGAVADFVSWSQNASDTLTQAEFYPELAKDTLFDRGYIALRSGHSRGSTMDLTIVQLPAEAQPEYVPGVTKLQSCHAPYGVRWNDNSIDMGTGFDCFSPVAWTNDTSISIAAQWNRLQLMQAMVNIGGFVNYDEEWWHYTLYQEPYPNTYFNFTIC